MKPPSPLRVPAEPRLKPSSPLRVRNGRFWCSFRTQRRWWFQWLLFRGAQWCCRFQVATLSRLVREKVRPARPDVCVSAKKFALCAQNGPKWAFSGVRASFFAEEPLEGPCWASFFADRQSWDPTGRTLSRRSHGCRPSTGSVNPSMRSYTHLAEAGCGRPTRPQQPTPQRKALTKGKRLLVKAVTSLDNGRKWRVCAGHTLELLR